MAVENAVSVEPVGEFALLLRRQGNVLRQGVVAFVQLLPGATIGAEELMEYAGRQRGIHASSLLNY
jgi:hypothetical protein